MGLPLDAGNRFCEHCRADFQWCTHEGTLELRAYDNATFPWASAWQGKIIPTQIWYLAAAGKQSQRPGVLCSACRTEFDTESEAETLKLITSAAQTLSPYVGSSFSFADWHRFARRLPGSVDEAKLRNELGSLCNLQLADKLKWELSEHERVAVLKTELDRLIKVAVLRGDLPAREPASLQVRLRCGEILRWSGQAIKHKVRSARGQSSWESDGEGTLFITSERIILDAPGQLWQRSLSKVFHVETQPLAQGSVLILKLDGQQKPVGLFLPTSDLEVVVEGHFRRIPLEPSELAGLFNPTRD
jgi:hypothetical protein